MKVLIINDFSKVTGGAERFLENLLHESGTSSIRFYRLDISDLEQTNFQPGAIGFIRNRFNRICIDRGLLNSIEEQIKLIQPDLIHLNNNNLFTNTVLRSLQSSRIPVVLFIHDYYALRRLHAFFFVHLTQRVTYATHALDVYQELLCMGKNARLVSVPFNHNKWSHQHIIDHTTAPLNLLYVGRLERSKGIFELIRSLELIKRHIPDIRLSILGDGSELHALERMVRSKGLTSNIALVGFQQDHEIIKYYKQARLLIFPSATESLGYVGLEAQSCGVPVLAFENKGISRWCIDNLSGFVVKGRSPQKLADKVMEIIYDDVLLTRISNTAKENIRLQAYNASGQEMKDMYKAILSW